ncbi:MAG TPA: GntR family transcriptional regulator, partial [Alicycliphilus sp.]|nr:GntR family transcriptional regulator [Alicycliphilus sp.]
MSRPATELPSSSLLPAQPTLRGKTGRSGRSLANLLSEEFENKIRQGLLREGEKLP